MSSPVTVVGIGADGWDGLGKDARKALVQAQVVLGGERQLGLLSADVKAERIAWPTPLLAALPGILEEHRSRRLAVLASGDPLFFGIGSTLVRMLGHDAVHVLPSVSSVSLACARLGWPLEDVDVLSAVGRPIEAVQPALQPARRVLVLLSAADGAAQLSSLLTQRGYGASRVTVLEQLGSPSERLVQWEAATWAGTHDPLAVVAVECIADATAALLPPTPGLPDDAFENDGQLTKREVRAMTLAALAPVPGQLLWDIGAGSGSIGIEWMRAHPSSRAIAVEPRADRRERIARNAHNLGVPGLQIVDGAAPEALTGLLLPDAIFVGGGVSNPDVLSACLHALGPGGRVVANAVTVESEAALAAWHARTGGTLTRIAIQRAEPVGNFSGWRPAMPVTQWCYRKPAA